MATVPHDPFDHLLPVPYGIRNGCLVLYRADRIVTLCPWPVYVTAATPHAFTIYVLNDKEHSFSSHVSDLTGSMLEFTTMLMRADLYDAICVHMRSAKEFRHYLRTCVASRIPSA